MSVYPPTIVWRHRKERLSKCSLRGLEKREDFLFFTYPKEILPDLSDYILLSVEGKPLEEKDCSKGILLLDGTWRYALRMEQALPKDIEKRSVSPCFRTAYPRKQTSCPQPDIGLASIEALFVAYHQMGRNTKGLLSNYYWKEAFLEKNKTFI